MSVKIGIIGGSGFNKASFFEHGSVTPVTTAWGEPSAPLREGSIAGVPVIQLARHGLEHTLSPSQVNYRANIQALKDAGCTCILATTAVGSLRAEIEPGDLVILDQFIDFTKQRKMTYFENFGQQGVQHTSMADPFHSALRQVLNDTTAALHLRHHANGTVVTIEGPRFSSRAESRMFRIWGADVVNMSIATEVVLAKELGLPYAALAMSTDYDSWKEDAEPTTWEEILKVFSSNVEKVMQVLMHAVPKLVGIDWQRP